MKYYLKRHCKWAIFLVVLSLPWVDSAEEKENQFSRVFRRLRRQTNKCQDGNGTVEGKTCCRCAAGQKLTKVCAARPDDRECAFCEKGKTYNTMANLENYCEPCTSCAQPNANLEVKDECTIAKDAVCRCKDGYYCISETCNSCNPCGKCEGTTVKKPCTQTINTVCEEKSEGPDHALGIPVAVVLVLMLVLPAIAVIICWRKKYVCFKKRSQELGMTGTYVEQKALLEDGDFARLVSDFAGVVGWADMKNIAIEAGFLRTSIENPQLNHPNNAKEQTIELLVEWGDRYGKDAYWRLLEGLKKKSIAKVEDVKSIVQKNNNSRN